MVSCDRCGRDIYMPFRCNYCGGYFCDEHRLPEFHECRGVRWGEGAINLGRAEPSRSPESFYSPYQTRARGSPYRFSGREIRDLAISLLIIAAIPFMWLGTRRPVILLGAIGIFSAAFLVHELAHKFSAQRLGYHAEFRINTLGLFITLLSFLSPVKVVAPGAVIVYAPMFGRHFGKISLAGPLTNIAQSVLYLFISLLTLNRLVYSLAFIGISINGVLALFNLIPFGLFDGAKIYAWDRKIWLATAVAAGLLFLYSVL